MSSSDANRSVVVRLLDGQSEQQELVLEVGRPASPILLGKSAGWRIEGRDIDDAHVMIAWNGTSLFVGLARGQHALLDGLPLAKRWTEVRMPSELRFGGARLSISRRAPDAATRPRRDDEVTAPEDERLQAALRLARDEDATCIADVVVPAEARRPTGGKATAPRTTPPAARPTLRHIPVRPPVRTAPNSERTIIARAPSAIA